MYWVLFTAFPFLLFYAITDLLQFLSFLIKYEFLHYVRILHDSSEEHTLVRFQIFLMCSVYKTKFQRHTQIQMCILKESKH